MSPFTRINGSALLTFGAERSMRSPLWPVRKSWAIGMALLTLQKIHATPQFRQSSQVKISRRQVKSIILGCQLLGRFDGPLRLYFRWLARGLPLMQRDPLELYQGVSAWNDIPL